MATNQLNYLQVGHVLPHRVHLLDALLHDVTGTEDGSVVLHRLLHLKAEEVKIP